MPTTPQSAEKKPRAPFNRVAHADLSIRHYEAMAEMAVSSMVRDQHLAAVDAWVCIRAEAVAAQVSA